MEPRFIHFDDVRPFVLADGVSGRPLLGQLGMREDYQVRWQAEQ